MKHYQFSVLIQFMTPRYTNIDLPIYYITAMMSFSDIGVSTMLRYAYLVGPVDHFDIYGSATLLGLTDRVQFAVVQRPRSDGNCCCAVAVVWSDVEKLHCGVRDRNSVLLRGQTIQPNSSNACEIGARAGPDGITDIWCTAKAYVEIDRAPAS